MMEAFPIVSVVIPVYNCERYLGEAIESVLAQTYPHLEILVIDDGSTDQSGAVAQSFGPRVRYFCQENSGIGTARNSGVEEISGDLLAFLDADDRWTDAKLALQVEVLLNHPAIDMVFGQARQLRQGPEWDLGVQQNNYDGPELMPGVIPGTMLIRREAFLRAGPFRTDLKIGEFIDWYARAVEAGLRQVLLPNLLLLRRLHDTNQGIRERQSVTDYARVLKASLDRRRSLKAQSR